MPGIEHHFFEEELDKMEQTRKGSMAVVLAVDNSSHSEFAFSCEYTGCVRGEGESFSVSFDDVAVVVVLWP